MQFHKQLRLQYNISSKNLIRINPGVINISCTYGREITQTNLRMTWTLRSFLCFSLFSIGTRTRLEINKSDKVQCN